MTKFIRMYTEKYDMHVLNNELADRVFLSTERILENKIINDPDYRIFVDEREINSYKGPYFAAVTTFGKPLVIL